MIDQESDVPSLQRGVNYKDREFRLNILTNFCIIDGILNE